MKEDVAKKIPPKEETIIEVEITMFQKRLYEAVLKRNKEFLYKGCKGANVPKLINIVMQLRKVINHPYLLEGIEEKAQEGLAGRRDGAFDASSIFCLRDSCSVVACIASVFGPVSAVQSLNPWCVWWSNA